MPKQRKLVTEADPKELREFADISLGLEVEGNENRAQILSKIRASHFNPDAEGAEIVIHEKPQPAATSVEGAVEIRTDPDGQERKYMAVTLHTSEGVGGDRPVPFRVNDKQMLIPRGERVWVPEEYVEAMRNAQQTVMEYTDNGVIPRGEVPSYNYSVG